MNNYSDINILPADGGIDFLNASVKSQKGNGMDIFQSMLQNITNSLNNSESYESYKTSFHSSVSNRKPLGSGIMSGSKLSGPNNANKPNKEELALPASFQNQLVAFFTEQGISQQKISQALTASKNAEGNIILNKLLRGLYNAAGGISGQFDNTILMQTFKEDFSAYLKKQGSSIDILDNLFAEAEGSAGTSALLNVIDKIKSNAETSNENSFIKSDQIPRTQSLLFKMGLGAEDVKNITEKCTNSNGDLEIGKLSAELSKIMSEKVKPEDIVKLFSKNDISVNRDFFKNVDEKTDTGNRISALENSKNAEEIKRNIISLLKEKGVSEEDIDSFIKDFDAEQIKVKSRSLSEAGIDVSKNVMNKIAQNDRRIIAEVLGKDEQEIKTGSWISAKQEIAAMLEKKGVPSKKIDNFMNSIESSIKKLNLYQDDNSVKSNILNEKIFSLPSVSGDQGVMKLSLADLLKMAEQKANSDQILKAAEAKVQGEAVIKDTASGKESKNFLVKETSDMSAVNIASEKAVKNSEAVKKANSTVNLPQPLPKIADRMIFMIRAGEQKSRLLITPPELGKLDIDLTVKNGHIHASLSAENVAVKEIIEANFNQLKQQLNDQGLTLDKFEVNVGLENGDKNSENAWAEQERSSRGSGGRSNMEMKNTGSEGILAAASSAAQTGTGSSNIDVHV